MKKCLVCLTEFEPHVMRPGQKYCSEGCLRKSMHARKLADPEYKSQKREYDKKYREETKEIKRERDMAYKDSIRFGGNGLSAMDRDGHKCTECGKTNRKSLIIHHKDHSGSSDKPNNELSNLVTLCRSCHMKHHASGDNNYLYVNLSKEQIEEAIRVSRNFHEVAAIVGVSPSTVRKKAISIGAKLDFKKDICKLCGNEFTQKPGKLYCSKECSYTVNLERSRNKRLLK